MAATAITNSTKNINIPAYEGMHNPLNPAIDRHTTNCIYALSSRKEQIYEIYQYWFELFVCLITFDSVILIVTPYTFMYVRFSRSELVMLYIEHVLY